MPQKINKFENKSQLLYTLKWYAAAIVFPNG